ncbi:hypothetical protein BC962_2346 [Gillisia mitskevichiae]|uniref:Uncharacterized protein n=1 Tax=Gillisia mitskevichiae TaxID=270921 RepID=A0A495PLJ9_9FLAO|nr:hypothetical protein [Gillisia mitskevichiae]RKS50575.1 hypothetical protein BC962_2346 [Gillisia mitskevichiae]
MKKILLFPLFGLFFISCSVDPIEEDFQQNQIQEFNAESNPNDVGCAGPDNLMIISYSQAAAIKSWDEVRKLYLSLLGDGIYRGGKFDPTIWDIINKFNDEEDGGLGDYTTWYAIDNDQCQDTVMLTLRVVPDQSTPICQIDAGPDNTISLTYSQAAGIESWDEVRKLYLSLLQVGVPRNGVFDPAIWDLINRFQNDPLGSFSTTYTIGEGDCKDSVILTVVVIPDEQEEPECELSAGADNFVSLSVSSAAAIESWDEVRKLYLSLLEPGISRNGTFSPSIWELIRMFNDPNRLRMEGDYITTYTIVEGECSDSVELKVVVISNP